MKNDFTFSMSTRIEFGEGKLSRTGDYTEELNASRVLVITDKGIAGTEIMGKVKNSLASKNIKYEIYDKVRENPRDMDAQETYDTFSQNPPDAVIACGGGSSMDLAKAVAALFTNGGKISEIINPNKLKRKPLPTICIPTTAGTGSEVTSFAVLTLEKEQRKSSVFDDKIRPDIAINDPEVLKSVPKSIGAATGMDALTHAIEAYTCRLSTPLTDAMALYAIKNIGENILDFVETKSDESCRAMMLGSLMAGIAFGFSDIAGVHCMAEALGGMYDTPHGVANSIFLPFVFEYNIEADIKKHRDVAAALGVDTNGKSDRQIAFEGAEWIRDMSERLEIKNLKEIEGVTPECFELLAEKCMKNVSLKSNARELSKEDFVMLYKKAYEYTR